MEEKVKPLCITYILFKTSLGVNIVIKETIFLEYSTFLALLVRWIFGQLVLVSPLFFSNCFAWRVVNHSITIMLCEFSLVGHLSRKEEHEKC